ncbi:GWxTD domain-containing protein [Fulvivirga sp. 29W222]|uniref:GWxTD domain-containing protein n=1 Tax=Fulvivirga marina TaxID=2494733 RepID=A0A937FVF4_9BACT|nr:GWxTD domain-containing protein [Fulvivirga marina]MBL6446860.1 GWxTD domain-containing protein [Fulvivirga marina]
MKPFQYLFILAFTLHGFLINAQPTLNTSNLAHQYNPESEIDVRHELVTSNDTTFIYLKLVINQSKPSLQDYTFDFFTAASYSGALQQIASNKIDSTYLEQVKNQHIIKFYMPKTELLSLGAIRVQSKFSGFTYFYDFNVDNHHLALYNSSNKIQFTSWVAPGKYHFNDQVYGYYYNHHFPPALPPMPVREDVPVKAMPIDSSFVVSSRQDMDFANHGLFLFQKDSSSQQGKGIRVENKYYPKLAKLEDLIEPLIYITTKEENIQLRNINGDKKAFDKFWLDLTKSQERARLIIKNYFDRVEGANRLFTTYKEGWKTDMGLIYIIFGAPDEVTKSNNDETWLYLASPDLPKLKFSFIRTESVFSSSHFVLVRNKNYASSWYRAIDLWRKGRF